MTARKRRAAEATAVNGAVIREDLATLDRGVMTAAEMGRRRWRGISKADRRRIMGAITSRGGRAAWAGMSAEQRSAEMRRRARKRKKRRKA